MKHGAPIRAPIRSPLSKKVIPVSLDFRLYKLELATWDFDRHLTGRAAGEIQFDEFWFWEVSKVPICLTKCVAFAFI